MLIVELMIDVGDAMGANVTNTMCETVAPLIEKINRWKNIIENTFKLFYKTNGFCFCNI